VYAAFQFVCHALPSPATTAGYAYKYVMSTVISISFYKSASWTTACMMPFRRRAIGYEFREITTQGYTAGTQFVDSILVSFLSSSRHGWGSSESLQCTGPSPSTPFNMFFKFTVCLVVVVVVVGVL